MEVNGIQIFSKSENLQLLMSIKGVMSEYVPIKNMRNMGAGASFPWLPETDVKDITTINIA